MTVISNPLLLKKKAVAAAAADPLKIARSLRFDSGDQANLERILTTVGDKRRFTISVWFKHTKLGDETNLLGNYETAGDWEGFNLYVSSSDQIEFHHSDGSDYTIRHRTTAKYRDCSAWYHLVVAVDTTHAVGNERCKMWVNGERVTSFESSVNTEATQNLAMEITTNSTQPFNIGYQYGYSDGYIADLYFIDGLALSPASFGEFDSNTRQWNPQVFSLPTPNTGSTYSSSSNFSVVNDSGNGHVNNPGNMFDGAVTGTAAQQIWGGSTVTYTFPTAIDVKSDITLYTTNLHRFEINPGESDASMRQSGSAGTIKGIRPPRSGKLKKIAFETNSGTQFSIYAIAVDGIVLKDSQTDPTTRGNPNDGTTWSGKFSGGNFASGNGATLAFDGRTDTMARPDQSQTITWTAPTSIPFNHLEFCGWNDNISDGVVINGVNISSTIAGATAEEWTDITSLITSPLSTIVIKGDSGSNKASIRGVKVNGNILLDSTVDNSFHLKFNDTSSNAALGLSSLPVDVNDPDKGGPILKTTATSSGKTLDSGTNTDSNASSLVLAIPGNSATDVHHTVKGSGSAKTITYTGTCSAKTDVSRYYGTSTYVKSDGYIKVSQTDDCLFSGQLTIEGWFYLDEGTNNCVLVWSDGTGTGRYLIWTDSSKLTLVVYSGNTPTQRIQGSTVLTTKRWYHMAMCRNSSDLVTLYLDGVSQGTWDSSSMSESLGGQNSDTAPEIGSQDGGNSMTGYLQDWRFYTTCKYTGNFDPQAPKDFTVNNLIAVSSGTTYSTGNDFGSQLYDGNIATNATHTTSTTYRTFTNSDIVVNSSFEVYTNDESGQVNVVKDTNGNEYQATDDLNGDNWRVLYNANSQSGTNFTGTLSGPLQLKVSYGGSYIRAIRVDGTILTDQTPGATDSVVDTPTNYAPESGDDKDGNVTRGNYSTWNPVDKSASITLSQGNLKATESSGAWTSVRSTMAVNSGKWYAEWEQISGGTGVGFGVSKQDVAISTHIGTFTDSYMYYSSGSVLRYDNTHDTYGASFTINDVIGCGFDYDNGKLYFYKNGTAQGTYTISGGCSGFWAFASSYISAVGEVNFGQRAFKYTNAGTNRPAAEYKSMCTQNLPDTFTGSATGTLNNPSKFFDAIDYIGNEASQTLTPDFNPDLVWLKSRDAGNHHGIWDRHRGNLMRLTSDYDYASTSRSNTTTFNSTHAIVGSSADYNQDDHKNIAWLWDSGTATATNTDGDHDVELRANSTAGIAIGVSEYDSTDSVDTIATGLNAPVEFAMVKNTEIGDNWRCYHKDLSTPNSRYLRLNTDDSEITSTMWSTSNTAFGINGAGLVGAGANQDIIAYMFTSISGFSSFGKYTGNDSTNGPFVYTGFKPRWIMIKNSGSGYTKHWHIYDTARDSFNEVNKALFANEANGGYTYEGANDARPIDILSNGFKIRESDSNINTAITYIYAAFAENPFKLSRAH